MGLLNIPPVLVSLVIQFIKAKPVEETQAELSQELKDALDEAIESKNYSTHSEVMEESKKRYPNLFK